MKALFGRKVCDIEELRKLTRKAVEEGYKGQDYIVTREVILEDKAFRDFTNDFLEDQPWITKYDGGANEKGEISCIRVINKDTGEKVLVNNEGYSYGRYIAIENS